MGSEGRVGCRRQGDGSRRSHVSQQSNQDWGSPKLPSQNTSLRLMETQRVRTPLWSPLSETRVRGANCWAPCSELQEHRVKVRGPWKSGPATPQDWGLPCPGSTR